MFLSNMYTIKQHFIHGVTKHTVNYWRIRTNSSLQICSKEQVKRTKSSTLNMLFTTHYIPLQLITIHCTVSFISLLVRSSRWSMEPRKVVQPEQVASGDLQCECLWVATDAQTDESLPEESKPVNTTHTRTHARTHTCGWGLWNMQQLL